MDSRLRIGEVAERVSVSVDAIRFYERKGLLPPAHRTSSGYRVFSDEIVERVRFIKQAQEQGFSLAEIGELLSRNGKKDCRRVHDLVEVKLAEIDRRLLRMRRFRQKLAGYLGECEKELSKHGDLAKCPVVEDIAHGMG